MNNTLLNIFIIMFDLFYIILQVLAIMILYYSKEIVFMIYNHVLVIDMFIYGVM